MTRPSSHPVLRVFEPWGLRVILSSCHLIAWNSNQRGDKEGTVESGLPLVTQDNKAFLIVLSSLSILSFQSQD